MMIDHLGKRVAIGDRTETIARFEVWFRTPGGLFSGHAEALDHCAALDVDPALSIVAVAVAVGEGVLYEELPR